MILIRIKLQLTINNNCTIIVLGQPDSLQAITSSDRLPSI